MVKVGSMAPQVSKDPATDPQEEPTTVEAAAAEAAGEPQPEVAVADDDAAEASSEKSASKEKRPKAEIAPPDAPESGPKVVTSEVVEATITSFTQLDESGDKRAMNSLAMRLGKEQPALLRSAAQIIDDEGETVGEAAVFYATLVWSMFERHLGRKAPRLLPQNLTDAQKILEDDWKAVEDIETRPVFERVSAPLRNRQPHIMTKLMELIEEDVREEAVPEAAAAALFPATQVAVEAFDAALKGTRPAQELAPIRREAPKVGRNEPCHCGSGKKFKRCHGAMG